MTSKSLLIVNANIVNEGQISQGDVFIRDGRIERVGFGLTGQQADRVIDAHGRHLMPGMIDDQVHFREPGLTHKGDIATESSAAVAGGITSFMDMPNTIPNTTTRTALADKYLLAAGAGPRQLRVLPRRRQRQHRGDPGRAPGADLRSQGVHGRLHRQHAGGRSGDAREDLRRLPRAHRHPLRGLHGHPGERADIPGALWRRRARLRAPADPLGGVLLSLVARWRWISRRGTAPDCTCCT